MADQLEMRFDARPQGSAPPATFAETVATAHRILEAFDLTIRVGDQEEAQRQAFYLETLCIDLNGGTCFGMATPGGGKTRLKAAVMAPRGTVPLWGQPGIFLVTLEAGCEAEVHYDGLFGVLPSPEASGFSVRVVDPSKPFLSETGYRSCLDQSQRWPPPPGMDVATWCRIGLDAYVVSKDRYKKPGLVPVEEKYRERYQRKET